MVDGEREVTVRAELPGVDPNRIEVSLSGTTLTIAGRKQSEREVKGTDFYRSERQFGAFRRVVSLPEGVDPEKVSAEYANGILTVRVGKSKAAHPKRITVARK